MDILKLKDTGSWNRQTEQIIAFCGLCIAAMLLGLYEFSGQAADLRDAGHNSGYAIWAYLGFCVLRMAWIQFSEVKSDMMWGMALLDIIFVSGIIYILSISYDGGTASVKSPVYTLYYVVIALHAMRFNPTLVIVMGLISILAWVLMTASLLTSGSEVSQGYGGFVAPESESLVSQMEKLLSLMIFIVLTSFSVMRAKSLFADASVKNISEIKMQEYQKSSQEKTEIMSNMSDDLRAPMNDVVGMTDALRKTKLSPQQLEYVRKIERSGSALLSIMEDIMDYTKLEMGELLVNPGEFDLLEMVEEVGNVLGPDARAKKLDFLLHVEAGSEQTLVGDEKRLKKVLLNLVENAIKFTSKGSVSLTVNSQALSREEAILLVTVSDTGIGIAPDKIGKIFDRTPQAIADTQRRYGGLGLGLSLAQSLVRASGGEIKVASEVGRGSSFSFELRLPFIRRESADSVFDKIVDLDKYQVLIVDDEPLSAGSLEQKLNDLGIRPKIVLDAETACKAITTAYNANKPYSLVLVDYDMPRWNGVQLSKLVRTRPQLANMGIIAVSTTDEAEVREEFETMDISAYLMKPFKARDFEAALLTALKRPRVETTSPISQFGAPEPQRKLAG